MKYYSIHGDIAYIIESGHIIREVKILRAAGDLYTLQFTDTGGGVKLREGRLYPSKKAAGEAAKKKGHTSLSLYGRNASFGKGSIKGSIGTKKPCKTGINKLHQEPIAVTEKYSVFNIFVRYSSSRKIK